VRQRVDGRRGARRAAPVAAQGARAPRAPRPKLLDRPEFKHLPDTPGVYIFRNAEGQPLYVGKSVRLRTRARSHFAPSADGGDWTAQATIVDHRATSPSSARCCSRTG
jgi:DNA polymerase-3 subunit epsilon